MRVHSKSPCRVDLAGGTLDIWPLYLFHTDAVTVNFAVDRYTYCDLSTRDDGRIVLRSKDLGKEELFESISDLRAAAKYRLPLPALMVKFFSHGEDFSSGITMETFSEAPAGAGISGSSSLMITACSALNKLTNRKYSIEKIREVAQNIEAQVLRVPTGSQDYYPAMYGGVSAMEMTPAGIDRKTVPVDLNELNSRFVLAYTGVPRNSGINNWEVMKGHIDGNRAIQKNFDRIASIANCMRTALTGNSWDDVGRLLREEWLNRRKNSPGITTELIDQLIASTRRVGSTGAKVCGAGGGGCVFFLVEPDARERVTKVIEATGAQVLHSRVANKGIRINIAE